MRPRKLIVAFCLISLAWTGASIADASREIKSAVAHAGMAASADNQKDLRLHLQYVLNCLEGADGADAAPSAKNPCRNLGNGAVHDVSPEKREAIESALALARQALKDDDFQKAKSLAAIIQSSLQK